MHLALQLCRATLCIEAKSSVPLPAYYVITVNGVPVKLLNASDRITTVQWSDCVMPRHAGNHRMVTVTLMDATGNTYGTSATEWVLRGRPIQWPAPCGDVVPVHSVLSVIGDKHQWRLHTPSSGITSMLYIYCVAVTGSVNSSILLKWQMPGLEAEHRVLTGEKYYIPIVVTSEPLTPAETLTVTVQHISGRVPVHYVLYRSSVTLSTHSAYRPPCSLSQHSHLAPSTRHLAFLFDMQEAHTTTKNPIVAWYNYLNAIGYDCHTYRCHTQPLFGNSTSDLVQLCNILRECMHTCTAVHDRLIVVVIGYTGETNNLMESLVGDASGMIFVDPVTWSDTCNTEECLQKFSIGVQDNAPNMVGIIAGMTISIDGPLMHLTTGALSHAWLSRLSQCSAGHVAINVHQLLLSVIQDLQQQNDTVAVLEQLCSTLGYAVCLFWRHGSQRGMEFVRISPRCGNNLDDEKHIALFLQTILDI